MSAPQPLPGLAQRLALVVRTLRHMIAARAGRDRSAAPIALLVWPYLHRLAKRFEAVARRVAEGGAGDAPTRTRLAAAPPRVRPPRASPRLPRGFAWMIRLAPEAAPLGGQLRTLLTDPEFSALLAADPRAGKILRPLCRMLGVRPDPDLPPALFAPPARRIPTALSPAPDRSPPQQSAKPDEQPLPLFNATPA